jgi:hypothetical protein
MSLVKQQLLYTQDVLKLVQYAKEHQYGVIFEHGEPLRIHLQLISPNGELLEYPEDYAFLADYWEELSPRNRNGRSYKEPRCGQFERIKE